MFNEPMLSDAKTKKKWKNREKGNKMGLTIEIP